MIAACPKCSARYRIEKERLQPEGTRLRCSRCEVVFRVRPPPPAAQPVAPASAPAPTAAAPETAAATPDSPTPSAEVAPPAAERSPAAEPAHGGPPRARALLALPDGDAGKETQAALQRWGLVTSLVHDGVQALLEIQRQRPHVAIVAKALPRMSGIELGEFLKANESLAKTQVVLVGALLPEEQERLAAEATEVADAWIESADLPDGLAGIFEGFDLPLYQPPRTSRRARTIPVADQQHPPVPAASSAPAPAQPDESGPQAEAARLARIIVSDIVLYNEEKFAAGLAAGDVVAALQDELEEGRALFRSRVDESVRDGRDHLAEELVRVARARAGA